MYYSENREKKNIDNRSSAFELTCLKLSSNEIGMKVSSLGYKVVFTGKYVHISIEKCMEKYLVSFLFILSKNLSLSPKGTDK